MKKSIYLAMFVAICFSGTKAMAQGMAVNTSGATASSSAMLDVSSTTKGMLVPRMTNVQRDAISSPATGLLIYQTDVTAGFYYYNGSAWTALAGSGGGGGTEPTGASPDGIPYTVTNHANTTVGSLYFAPNQSTANTALTVANSTMAFTTCHPTLTAYGAGASSNFPLTVGLIPVTYSTSSVNATAGSAIGTCVINAAGGSCTIDVLGTTIAAGSGVTFSATSAANPIILNTVFSCK